MDSFDFHFERMNNLDLHPLSLPISRLSPAKSTSSIDQYTHHHGKGDSAYSSFSGGSNVPDYPSPFIPDELQPHSLHYADMKYVKAVYNPNVLNSDAKSMDQLYRSMEAISQQYSQNNSNDCLSTQDHPPPPPPLPPPPPPPPARLDSFVTIRNLENSRARQSPEGQQADPRSQAANPDTPCSRPDPVYGHRVSQHFQRDLVSQCTADQIPEPQMSASALSRLPQRTGQPEHLKKQAGGGQSESQRKRAHSAYGALHSEQQCTTNSWHTVQNMINGSIQHKGQFYFITGVCKSPESSLNQTPCESGGSTVEPHRQGERERSHSTMDNMFRNVQPRRSSSHDAPGEFFHQDQELSTRNHRDEEHPSNNACNPSHNSEQDSNSLDELEHGQKVMGWEIGRNHTTSHPIFYCGPEERFPPSSNSHSQVITPALPTKDQATHPKKDVQSKRGRRQPLGDVPSEKISKETTPLLYHLTGANRVAFMSKFKNESDSDVSSKDLEWNKGTPRQVRKEGSIHREEKNSKGSSSDTQQSETSKEEGPETLSYPCSTLDDSFKKYYKERLKDAQSKVLRETSFKRKDLQLSCPHRIRQRPEQRPSVLPWLEAQPTADHPCPPQAQPHGKEKVSDHVMESMKENMKDFGRESEKQTEKESEKPPNIAQPQVARIGGRKRLTAEQKKLCYSEPEKLHQLADGPTHMTCRSLGNEKESQLFDDDLGEQGLVASRRKMFETRGRALSASSLSKTTIKHLQHKALVAYMERKTAHKVTEPQQLVPQAPSQRHSTAGKPSDSGPRPHFANAGPKKKLHRPLSAGRILDSSTSSIRYAQFSSAQPSSHSRQSSWKETAPSSPGKSASVESLLDQREQPDFFRCRSTSTPHASQIQSNMIEPSSACTTDISSTQKRAAGETVAYRSNTASVPEERLARAVAQRGKSMEELGMSKVSGPQVLSKSSEQLDQLRSGQAGPGREKRSVSFFGGEGQVKAQSHTQRMLFFLEQDSTPQTGSEEDSQAVSSGPKDARPSDVPASAPFSRVRSYSASPGSSSCSSFPTDSAESSSDAPLPLSTHSQESSEAEARPTSTPSLPKGPSESKPGSSKRKTASPAQSVELSPEDGDEGQRPDSCQEVSLSHGVTTDPSLWISIPELEQKEEGECPPPHESTGSTQEAQNQPPSPPREQTAPSPAVPDAEAGPSTEEEDQAGEGREEEEENVEAAPPPGETGGPERTSSVDGSQWEVLVEEVVSADQSLARALCPATNRKTALMLMEQLLSEDTLLMEEHYKKKLEQRANDSTETTDEAEKAPSPSSPSDENVGSEAQPQEALTGSDLTEKKRRLMACVEQRRRGLEEQRSSLQEDERENGARGAAMEAVVRECCVPMEQERYALFIGDLERVVSLLLCLSARLARVQNALSTVDQHTDAEEKQSLDNRHRLLCKQREDAKDLKDNLDRRERVVSAFLSKTLTAGQMQEYRRFVQTKASLLIRQKDLDERQRLGEEQLEALLNTLPP